MGIFTKEVFIELLINNIFMIGNLSITWALIDNIVAEKDYNYKLTT